MSPLRPLCAFIESVLRALGRPLYTLPLVGSKGSPRPLPRPLARGFVLPCGKEVRGAREAPEAAAMCSSATRWVSSSTSEAREASHSSQR